MLNEPKINLVGLIPNFIHSFVVCHILVPVEFRVLKLMDVAHFSLPEFVDLHRIYTEGNRVNGKTIMCLFLSPVNMIILISKIFIKSLNNVITVLCCILYIFYKALVLSSVCHLFFYLSGIKFWNLK